jgi:hypothetical protein
MSAHVTPRQVQAWQACLVKFFADPDLPDDIRALEPEVYCILHYETAGRYYRVGAVDQAQHHLRQAIHTCTSLDEEWLLQWIAGTALDPRTRCPERFIDRVFDNLPAEAITLRPLRRRAHGRYHAAAAFSAYQSHSLRDAIDHILPAVRGDPSIIRNRGFLRVAIQSLLERPQGKRA